MKTFLTKKNLAIVLAVLLVVAVVVLCITLRQKRVEDMPDLAMVMME